MKKGRAGLLQDDPPFLSTKAKGCSKYSTAHPYVGAQLQRLDAFLKTSFISNTLNELLLYFAVYAQIYIFVLLLITCSLSRRCHKQFWSLLGCSI